MFSGLQGENQNGCSSMAALAFLELLPCKYWGTPLLICSDNAFFKTHFNTYSFEIGKFCKEEKMSCFKIVALQLLRASLLTTTTHFILHGQKFEPLPCNHKGRGLCADLYLGN